jgi:ABC-type branched-subunit amino acid transport system ATPase component
MASRDGEPGGTPFLEVEGLTKAFGGVLAVDHVDLTLGPNEMRCIIGPNGCGKTTLFNLITGYLPPTSGSVRFEGRDIPGRPLDEIADSGIVRKFQVPSVFPGLSVRDNLRTARTANERNGDAIAMARRLGLGAHLDEPAGTLSHGQKQWLELALVLATSPRLVLLDEPAAGMTRAEKAETVALIDGLRDEGRVAILLIEHDMTFVEALDCPVSVMVMGRIVASGSFAEVRAEKSVRDAYLGTAYG